MLTRSFAAILIYSLRAAAMLWVLTAFVTTIAIAEDTVGISYDGLVPVKDAKVDVAQIDPGADFSIFKKVMILDPLVSFRSNWERDQNRSRTRRLRPSDIERIKADTASMFKDVFEEKLAADGGYDIVTSPDYDVLLLRPAIIDLDITAPETRSAGRNRTYTSSAGAATLYLELFDSVSGQIIGRAADRKAARGMGGHMTWSNSVTNSAEARRIMGRWADTLRNFLDQHYSD